MIPNFWMTSAIFRCILLTLIISFEFAKCLNIDNKLSVIRNDCYERLAIGQKLRFNDIDKILILNTVQDCQLACTHEEKNCRSFSFGIGMKGNSTCELSKMVIRETPDLKPIGTLDHIDFDLYIKKLGCKLVINKETANIQPKPLILSIANPETTPQYNTRISNRFQSNTDEYINNHNYESDAPVRVQSSLISVASGANEPIHLVSPVFESSKKDQQATYGSGKPYYPNRFNYEDTRSDHEVNYYRPYADEYKFTHYDPRNRDRHQFDYNEHAKPVRPIQIPDPPKGYGDYNPYFDEVKPHHPIFEPDRPHYNNDPYGSNQNENNYNPPKPLENDYMHEVSSEPTILNSTTKTENFNISNNGISYQTNQNKPNSVPKPPQLEEQHYGEGNKMPNSGSQTVENYGKDDDKQKKPTDIPERSDQYYGRPNPSDQVNYNRENVNRPYNPSNYYDRYNGYNGNDLYKYPENQEDYYSRPERPDYYDKFDNRRPDKPSESAGGYNANTNLNRPYKVPEIPVNYYDRYDLNRPTKIPSLPQNVGSYHPSENHHYYDQFYLDLRKRPHDNLLGYQSVHQQRPHDVPNRPSSTDYDAKPYRPEAPYNDPNYSPQSSYYDTQSYRPNRPRPERPHETSNIPESSYYDIQPYRPNRPLPERPHETSNSHQQSDYDTRPYRPSRPSAERPYEIPNSPQSSDYDTRPYRPNRPSAERPYEIPNSPQSSDYDTRPYRPNRPSTEKPYNTLNSPQSSDYDTRPYRPNRPRPEKPHETPITVQSSGYDTTNLFRPTRPSPLRPLETSYSPQSSDYDTNRPSNPRPSKPLPHSERPHQNSHHSQSNGYDSKPYRPTHSRPVEINYDHNLQSKPLGHKQPSSSVSNSNGYGQEVRPTRPHRIPSRPLNNADNYYNKEEPWRNSERDSYRRYEQFEDNNYYDDRSYYQTHSVDDRYGYDDYSESRPYRPSDVFYRPGSYYEQTYDRPYILPWDKQYYAPRQPYGSYYDRVLFDNDFKRPVYVPKVTQNNHTYKETNKTYNDNSTINNSTKNYVNISKTNADRKQLNRKPIVTETIGSHGETITSIITEIPNNSCFRRVLAGKRVLRAFVRRAVLCERVEDCQRECSEEKRFVCEGFNYRLDPTGRSQGDCELIDLPLSRLDIRRDVFDDPEYDYYERDRNSDTPDCKGTRFYGYNENGYQNLDRRYDYYNDHGRNEYYDDYYQDRSYDYRPLRPIYDDRYDQYDGGNHRGGKNYNHQDRQKHYQSKNDYDHYNKPPRDDDDNFYKPIYQSQPYDYKSYEPYLPQGNWKYEGPYYNNDRKWDKYFHERVNDRNYWGFSNDVGGWGNYGGSYGNFGAPDSYFSYDYYNDNNRNNNRHHYNDYDKKYFFVPDNNGGSKDWGHYGGSYGYGDHKHVYNNNNNNNNKGEYDYWGFNGNNGLIPPYEKPVLDPYPPPKLPPAYNGYGNGVQDPNYQTVLKDECSLRMVTGFRLHKGIIKKLTAVSSIYECELLCYKEREFTCNSYAFRYTANPNSPLENCYLSDRDYKELDHYTDLEPDRDCDVYKMHNQERCDHPIHNGKDESDCFLRVRSSHRLDHVVVRDSLNVKSIIDCQLECLRSITFTCRAFSFRYGPPTIGGAIDNCQLTDRPFLELNPLLHIVPESGFELYERGSYGHGCEPNHFQIGTKPHTPADDQINQVCYLGYGTPSRLLTQATKKSLRVTTEEECKNECTKARETSLFQCMSLSYRTLAPPTNPNCDLSDIVQRDLLSDVDYVADENAWLFAWDIHNPTCNAHMVIGIGGIDHNDISGHGHVIHGHGHEIHGHGHEIHGHGHEIHGHGHEIHGHHSHGQHGYPGDPGKEIIPWINPGDSLNTWKIYSVGGLPCKRGSLCKENKVAGFWYCELEGREEHAWDYCCRPDHQCGFSEGFQYQWCYVGPAKTQWRKCSDEYYPYDNNGIDYNDRIPPLRPINSYSQQWASSNSINSVQVPDLHHNKKPTQIPPRQPSLTAHDSTNNNHFLDPPKPGGFNRPRHWPISYLHKEIPPNATYSDYRALPKDVNSETAAISNLISAIKSNTLQGAQYQIAKNETGKSDETLYVQIPLPSNYNSAIKKQKTRNVDSQNVKQEQTILPQVETTTVDNGDKGSDQKRTSYSRSFITRANRTLSNQRRSKSTKGIVQVLPSPN